MSWMWKEYDPVLDSGSTWAYPNQINTLFIDVHNTNGSMPVQDLDEFGEEMDSLIGRNRWI